MVKGRTPFVSAAVCIAIGCIFWLVPPPEGLQIGGWRLLGIFIATILAIILNVMPIGALSIIAITLVAMTCVTDPKPKTAIKDALSGFQNSLIWLIGAAIIISRGIIKTGLGRRIGYFFMSLFGKKTLGVAYSLVISDAILSPITPSNTARGGGIVHPVMKSIASSYNSSPENKTEGKIGKYLALVNFQANPITSCMFLTACAPNPLVVDLISKGTNGKVNISWGDWALAMFLPGVVCLAVVPLVVYLMYPPEIKSTPNATVLAKEEISKMGKITRKEYTVLFIFLIMLLLWAGVADQLFGISVNASSVAFLGLSLSLITGVLTWDDVLQEKSAWDTIIWFSALVMMATYLGKLGVIGYFAKHLKLMVESFGFSWVGVAFMLSAIYLYLHYFFASTTAHVSAMLGAFYAAGLALGTPPMLYALMLAASGNIMMCLTNYSTGTAPVIYGSKYTTLGEWWKVGFVMSVVNSAIFILVAGVWWKWLGHY